MNPMRSASPLSHISVRIACLLLLTACSQLRSMAYEVVSDPALKEAAPPTGIMTQSTVGINDIGGPDGGGYYYFDNTDSDIPAFDWIEVSGSGTFMNLGDDYIEYPINLPFEFNFYDADYNQIGVDSNGGIVFENDYLLYINECIPGENLYGVQRFIGLYWDDLRPDGVNNVYYQVVGSAPNRKMVIQWQDVYHFGSTTDSVTMQVQLYENGDILMLYADPSNEAGSGATIGIQDDPTRGLQYSCNESVITEGLAILFTKYPCDSPLPAEEPQPADGTIDVPVSTLLEWERGGNCQDCGLQNGGFETGNSESWSKFNSNAASAWHVSLSGNGAFGNGYPDEGDYYIQNSFDGSAGTTADLYQQTSVPACAPHAILTWSERIQWDMAGGPGVFPREYIVTIESTDGGTTKAILYDLQLSPGTSGDTGYVTHQIDLLDILPSLAGQGFRINFHLYVPETNTGPAQFDLDGLSLVCGAETQLITPMVEDSVTVQDTEDVMVNGDFEAGTLDGWTVANDSALLGTFVINDGTLQPYGVDDPQPPYAGNYSALCHQQGIGTFTIYQDVTLPDLVLPDANVLSITLSWVDMIRNHHTSFDRFFLPQYEEMSCV